MSADLLDPLITQSKLWRDEYSKTINKAERFWKMYIQALEDAATAQKKAFKLKEEASRIVLTIEDTMSHLDKGMVTSASIQKLSQQGSQLLCKSDTAQQDYIKCVNAANDQINRLPVSYLPLLAKVQKGEEQRIGLIQSSISTVMKHITRFGNRIAQTQHASEQTAAITPSTDLNFFINAVSPLKIPLPMMKQVQVYKESLALTQLKQ